MDHLVPSDYLGYLLETKTKLQLSARLFHIPHLQLLLLRLLCTITSFPHISQLPSISPWSSKEGTVQTSSPSYVDIMNVPMTQTGYTMGQWGLVDSLPLPSLG